MSKGVTVCISHSRRPCSSVPSPVLLFYASCSSSFLVLVVLECTCMYCIIIVLRTYEDAVSPTVTLSSCPLCSSFLSSLASSSVGSLVCEFLSLLVLRPIVILSSVSCSRRTSIPHCHYVSRIGWRGCLSDCLFLSCLPVRFARWS